jgi:hypothetical protein
MVIIYGGEEGSTEEKYFSWYVFTQPRISMDDSSYRRNFDLDKKNEIHYHSWKEHLKMSKIAKFGREML